jgi:hypothetical protein
MTPQTTFMMTATIRQDQLGELRVLLANMNSAPGFANPRNALLPYWQFKQLHVARFTILQANTNEDIRSHGIQPKIWRPALCFMGDIDGDAETFLAEMVIRAEPGLRSIFSLCEGFDPLHTNLLEWMRQHSHKPAANYVNWQGRTVEQIREELALREVLASEVRNLHNVGDQQLNARQLWRRLQQFTQEEVAAGRIRLTATAATPIAWRIGKLLHLIIVPLVVLCLSPLLVLALPFYLSRLRKLELSDPENTLRADAAHVQALSAQEDIDVTNHFNVFGQIKPGPLRLFTIRTSLVLLDYAIRHIYTRGYLTRIQTIHFARWVLLDNNRRVFFASNYDGSASSYMDDFINKVAWGLNLVFSNGVGYPRTHWLLKGGAQNEQRYKRTLRRNQLPSESWYKAYPDLTAADMARNSRIRQVLESDNPSDQELNAWLGQL